MKVLVNYLSPRKFCCDAPGRPPIRHRANRCSCPSSPSCTCTPGPAWPWPTLHRTAKDFRVTFGTAVWWLLLPVGHQPIAGGGAHGRFSWRSGLILAEIAKMLLRFSQLPFLRDRHFANWVSSRLVPPSRPEKESPRMANFARERFLWAGEIPAEGIFWDTSSNFRSS